MDVNEAKALLRSAMDAQGVKDRYERAGIAAICMGESGMLGHVETGYAHTADNRIRQVFGSRVANLTNMQLDELKSDDRKFFEFVYGYQTHTGHVLGNTQPGDGYKYRGRFGLQVTGRSNYTVLSHDIGHPEVINDPDVGIHDPKIGMAMCVAYIRHRYDGSGFTAMLRSVGNNTPDIEATKRRYYRQFLSSGEFA